MNTIDINVIRASRPVTAVAIFAAFALGLAAIATLLALANVTSAGVFAEMSGYITKVGEALGSE